MYQAVLCVQSLSSHTCSRPFVVGLSACTCSLETPLAAWPLAVSIAVPTVMMIFVFKRYSSINFGNVRLQAAHCGAAASCGYLRRFLCAQGGCRSAMSHPRRALAGDRRLTTLHHRFHDRWLMRTIVALIALSSSRCRLIDNIAREEACAALWLGWRAPEHRRKRTEFTSHTSL
jgi:hypothetical protein